MSILVAYLVKMPNLDTCTLKLPMPKIQQLGGIYWKISAKSLLSLTMPIYCHDGRNGRKKFTKINFHADVYMVITLCLTMLIIDWFWHQKVGLTMEIHAMIVAFCLKKFHRETVVIQPMEMDNFETISLVNIS